VQCYRAAVTDDHTAQFFSEGRRPGVFGDFLWSLDRPEPFPSGPVAGAVFLWGPIPPATSEEPLVPLPMQHAWDAAVAAWKAFIAAIANGELIASGVHPGTGVRSELHPTEWARTGLVLDVRNGDLIEGWYGRPYGKHTVRWSAITLRAAKQPRQKKGRGHGYDWDGAWAYATTLRADDQWNWTQHRRDKKQPLPAVRKTVEDKIKQWFAAKGSAPNMSDIRQNITIPLYAGRRTRASESVEKRIGGGPQPLSATISHFWAWGGMRLWGHAKALAARPSRRVPVRPTGRAADRGPVLHGDHRSAGG
jgi:hypothetical protein